MAKNIPRFTYYTGDVKPLMYFTINKDDGSGYLNLTGTSVNCFFRLQGSASTFLSGANTLCTIVTALSGAVTYQLPAAFTDPGVYTGQLVITQSGQQQRTQRFEVEVLEGLPFT